MFVSACLRAQLSHELPKYPCVLVVGSYCLMGSVIHVYLACCITYVFENEKFRTLSVPSFQKKTSPVVRFPLPWYVCFPKTVTSGGGASREPSSPAADATRTWNTRHPVNPKEGYNAKPIAPSIPNRELDLHIRIAV